MPIKLNGATSGSVELGVPDVVGSDVQNVLLPSTAGTLDRLERAGNILQVVQNHITSTSSVNFSTGATVDIPGFSQSITPTSSSSKILVRMRWSGEPNNANNYDFVFRLKRNNTRIGEADAAGNRPIGISCIAQGYWGSDGSSTPDSSWFEYLDSPNSTATVTYQVCIRYGLSVSGTLFTNRSATDTDGEGHERLTSTITLMEVAG
jgi:hypothetical protein